MKVAELEKYIYTCPYVFSAECKGRLKCKPIPGGGSSNPIFILVGLNPAARENVWQSCHSLEACKDQYVRECMDPNFRYSKLIGHLEARIPDFRILRTAYLTDIVKCPTDNNKPPSDAMVERCKAEYWEDTIDTLSPKYVIVLGNSAARAIGGPAVNGVEVKAAKLADYDCWFIFAPHPSYKSIGQIAQIADNIANAVKNPASPKVATKIPKPARPPTYFSLHKAAVKTAREKIQSRLLLCGYRKQGNKMVKAGRVVNIVCSQEYGSSMRVRWNCIDWANDYVAIYDYSAVGGPTCIVPLEKLFATSYIKELKTKKSYKNNAGEWSDTFRADKEIAQLVLNYKGRWDIL